MRQWRIRGSTLTSRAGAAKCLELTLFGNLISPMAKHHKIVSNFGSEPALRLETMFAGRNANMSVKQGIRIFVVCFENIN